MRKWKAAALALGLLAASMAGALGEEVPELIAPADAAVSKTAVTRGSIARMQPYQAVVVPKVTPLSFAVDGVVGEVYVIPGQTVSTGDELAALDVDDVKESIAQLKEELEYQKSLYALQSRIHEIDLEIATMEKNQLTDADDIALKEIDLALKRTQIDEARDTFELEQRLGQETLDKLEAKTQGVTLIAPCEGVVTATRRLTQGTGVLAEEDVLWLADDSQLYVQCEFQTKEKMDAAVRVYVIIGGQEYPCQYVPMDEKEYVAQTLLGGSMTSLFALTEIPQGVRAGLSAAVCVITQQKDDVLVVPSSAVYRAGASRFVYVIRDDQSMELRYVQTGIATDLKTEIVSGLTEGELIYVKE